MLEHETEVRRGMDLLDEICPDWIDRVNLDTLNISSCTDCVLGQLCGDYRDRYYAYPKMKEINSDRYGFTSTQYGGAVESGSLTDTWKILIRERRDQQIVDVTHRSTSCESREFAMAGH